MPHRAWKTACLLLGLAVALVGGVQAQQQQHHPGSVQAPRQPSAESGTDAPAQSQQMQGMMGRGGTRGQGGMMGRQGMGRTAQEEDDEEDDEEASPQRGLMDRRGMMGRHMERLAQQLEITDEQQTQIRMLLRTHAKEAIRLRADIGVLAVDIQQVLDTDPVDLPKAKQLFQSMAMKEADLHLAHLTLMQEVTKLLTPEQQKKFRSMRARLMGMGRMMGPGGMPGRWRGER